MYFTSLLVLAMFVFGYLRYKNIYVTRYYEVHIHYTHGTLYAYPVFIFMRKSLSEFQEAHDHSNNAMQLHETLAAQEVEIIAKP